MRWTGCAGALVAAVSTSATLAQQVLTPELVQRDVKVAVDSGAIANPDPHRAITWTTDLQVPEATWLRLTFDEVTLGHAPDGLPTLLRITSLTDGASQTHTSATLAQWQYTSAYFNGDAVRIELIAPPLAAASTVRMSNLWAGEFVAGGTTTTICGPSDDRVLLSDDRAARALPIGCIVVPQSMSLISMYGPITSEGTDSTISTRTTTPIVRRRVHPRRVSAAATITSNSGLSTAAAATLSPC